MYIGNVMLLVLNMPLIGMWVQVLKLPYSILFPLIILFSHRRRVLLRATTCSTSIVMIVFGVLGYLMRKFGYEPAPLVLAFVLGPMLENNLRKSLILSHGDLMTFVAAADLGGLPGAGRRCCWSDRCCPRSPAAAPRSPPSRRERGRGRFALPASARIFLVICPRRGSALGARCLSKWLELGERTA